MAEQSFAGTRLFRKRPVNVKAWKIEIGAPYPDWVHHAMQDGKIVPKDPKANEWGEEVIVKTNEGDLSARPGQWLLQAEDGRIWPTDNAYFTANYAPIPY
jgi:hypothetical protein